MMTKPNATLHVSLRLRYILAACIWAFAGVKVFAIAYHAYEEHAGEPWWGTLLWLAISLCFFAGFIFPRVVQRNISYTQQSERMPLWACFSPSSWLTMLVMMSFGFSLRFFDLVPSYFVVGFYTGIALSLLLCCLPYLKLLRAVRP